MVPAILDQTFIITVGHLSKPDTIRSAKPDGTRRLKTRLVPLTRTVENNLDALSPVAIEDLPLDAGPDRLDVVRVIRHKHPKINALKPAAGNDRRAASQKADPSVAHPGLPAICCACDGAENS